MARNAGKPRTTRPRVLGAILLISITLLCCVGSVVKVAYDDVADKAVLGEVSSRLGVAPEWPAVGGWLKAELRPGITRAEVHSAFQLVGQCNVYSHGAWDYGTPASCDSAVPPDRRVSQETFVFVLRPVASGLGNWICDYDGEDLDGRELLRECWLAES